ncbi:MAG: hypothetical protein CM1200mP36_00720 [Gammaproteobacteria bacterium]|nr:MAG: hypothetical protein CM1200mP36_00720 [Gammaproteobacteria bacterium]
MAVYEKSLNPLIGDQINDKPLPLLYDYLSTIIFSPFAYRPWKRNQSSADKASGKIFFKNLWSPSRSFSFLVIQKHVMQIFKKQAT